MALNLNWVSGNNPKDIILLDGDRELARLSRLRPGRYLAVISIPGMERKMSMDRTSESAKSVVENVVRYQLEGKCS